jgi:hypothetical protein
MRATAVRRTAMTSSALALAILVTACGSDQGGGDQKATATAKSGKPAAKTLTAAELEKAVVAQGDVKDHEIKKPGKDDVLAASAVTVDKPECEPVAQLVSSLPTSAPKASVQRLVVHKSEKAKKGAPTMKDLAKMTEKEAQDAMIDSLDITKTMTSLYAYGAGGAEKALTALRAAAKKCDGGFVMMLDGEKQQVTYVRQANLSAGDDGAAWSVGVKQDGTPASTNVAVFRKGTTLATFSSFNIAAVSRNKAFAQPSEVINAQAVKLG